jgi:hypothetical protein
LPRNASFDDKSLCGEVFFRYLTALVYGLLFILSDTLTDYMYISR